MQVPGKPKVGPSESRVGEGLVVVEATQLTFRFRGLRVQEARHLVGSMELEGEEKL